MSSISLSPAPHVRVAQVEEDLVLLDLDADAYFCLVGSGASLDLDDRGWMEIGDAALADDLIEAGLAQATRSVPLTAVRLPPHPTRSSRSSAFAADRPETTPERLRFIWAVTRSTVLTRGRSVSALVGEPSDPPPSAGGEADVLRHAHLFARWLPWTPFQGRCLYRAHALRGFLRSAGLDACWVFGVRTWPFAAHCWLQIGDLVLDDDVDAVRLYQPIYAA